MKIEPTTSPIQLVSETVIDCYDERVNYCIDYEIDRDENGEMGALITVNIVPINDKGEEEGRDELYNIGVDIPKELIDEGESAVKSFIEEHGKAFADSLLYKPIDRILV